MSAPQTLTKQQEDTAEGFHQSWFPLALASEVVPGQVVGRDFLGTRVIVYRATDGRALVQSAFCPHLGADLSERGGLGPRLGLQRRGSPLCRARHPGRHGTRDLLRGTSPGDARGRSLG